MHKHFSNCTVATNSLMKLYSDGMYGKSNGGKTFSGWTCDYLPYLVELDNFGANRHQGQPGGPNERLYGWARNTGKVK